MSNTILKPEKVLTVAHVAKFFVDTNFDEIDKLIAQQMVAEGIRKIHDAAESFRGRGKYLGHAHWSRNALALLSNNGGKTSGITKNLAHEHVIPVNVLINQKLFANPIGTDIEEYEKQICDFSIVAIVTREEERKICKAGYAKLMPPEWQKLGAFARYICAGLVDDIISS